MSVSHESDEDEAGLHLRNAPVRRHRRNLCSWVQGSTLSSLNLRASTFVERLWNTPIVKAGDA